MATTTGTFNFFNSFREFMADGTLDLDNADAILCGLTTSAWVPDAEADQGLADISNEVVGNGYSRQTLTGITWNRSTVTVTYDSNNPVFTASGGSIVARFWFTFNDTVTTPVVDPLYAWGLLDNTPADVTTTDGNTLTVQVNASGWFTLT